MKFDDVGYSSGGSVAPTKGNISNLINFARAWNGSGDLPVHWRAGTPRRPVVAMIVLAAVPQLNLEVNFKRLLAAKCYYRPNTTMLRLAGTMLGSNLAAIAKDNIVRHGSDNVEMTVVQLSTAAMPPKSF